MTVLRVGCVLLLFLPVACSGSHVNPRPLSIEEGGDKGPDGDDPTDAAGYVERAEAFAEREEYEKAVADYEEAIRLAPDDPDAYNSLAWLLATCTEDRVRDGKKAIPLATKACELSGWEDADTLSTLAAAHAECGNFAEAVRWQKKALKLGFHDSDDTDDARKQLKLYEAGKPYREE